MPSITDPITIRGLTLRNRIWIAPMCQYSVDRYDGVPTMWHAIHYGALAAGGTGLLMVEATAVLPEARVSRQDTGIWNDEQRDAWGPIVDHAHAQGAAIGVQLTHGAAKGSRFAGFGRDGDRRGSVEIADGGWTTVSPSAVEIQGLAAPRALHADELPEIVDAWVQAARRSVSAGFDVVEIHAAHGYLFHEFLSPLTNRRTDSYGGSLEGRARLLLETVRAIRQALPELPVIVRLSATDWVEKGWNIEDTAVLARWLIESGADFIDASSGGLVIAEIPIGPGYQVPFAERLAAEGIPVSAVGIIETSFEAQAIIDSGVAAVRVARPALRDPNLPIRWARELGVDIDWIPDQYLRAYR